MLLNHIKMRGTKIQLKPAELNKSQSSVRRGTIYNPKLWIDNKVFEKAIFNITELRQNN